MTENFCAIHMIEYPYRKCPICKSVGVKESLQLHADSVMVNQKIMELEKQLKEVREKMIVLMIRSRKRTKSITTIIPKQ